MVGSCVPNTGDGCLRSKRPLLLLLPPLVDIVWMAIQRDVGASVAASSSCLEIGGLLPAISVAFISRISIHPPAVKARDVPRPHRLFYATPKLSFSSGATFFCWSPCNHRMVAVSLFSIQHARLPCSLGLLDDPDDVFTDAGKLVERRLGRISCSTPACLLPTTRTTTRTHVELDDGIARDNLSTRCCGNENHTKMFYMHSQVEQQQ